MTANRTGSSLTTRHGLPPEQDFVREDIMLRALSARPKVDRLCGQRRKQLTNLMA